MMQIRSSGMIALGGNVPIGTESPVMTLVRAVACLPDAGLTLRRVSRFFDTPCFPAGAGPDYVNAAVQFETGLKAPEVLSALHRVEAAFRRKREQRWAGRTLDLDLLAMGQEVLPDHETQITWQRLSAEEQARVAPDRLVLPHPRLQDRAFVLIPMADIAPDWTHPVLGKTVAEMLAALPQRDIDSVRPI